MTLPASLQALVIDAPNDPRRIFAGLDKSAVTFLRADNKEAMDAAFVAAGIVPQAGQTLPPDFHWPGVGDISVVGTIYNNDAVWGPAGADGFPTLTTPPTAKAGWHVNVLPPA